jgi:hypothetical protein
MARLHDSAHTARRLAAAAAFVLAVAALLGVFAAVHARQGLARPMPWIDEASFLWQAQAVQRDGTLFAPELRSDGPLLWMPPGYMVTTGLALRLTDFSLETARDLSALFLAGALAALAAVFARLRHPFAALPLLAAFALCPIAQLVGNVARMESLVLCLASFALVLFQRRALLGALGLGAVLPLVHPMGAFFGAGLVGGAAVIAVREPSSRRARPWELALIGVVAVA